MRYIKAMLKNVKAMSSKNQLKDNKKSVYVPSAAPFFIASVPNLSVLCYLKSSNFSNQILHLYARIA